MAILSIAMTVGYVLLGTSMILGANYMDAFVAFSVSSVFIFGLTDIFSSKKRGMAHVLTGGLMGTIFTAYYAIEYISSGFNSLISSGFWSSSSLITFLGTIVLGVVSVVCLIISKKSFKSAKMKKGG